MPELGRAALAVTFGLVLYALVAGTRAATRRRRLAESARALVASFFSTLVAAAVLVAALVRHDFAFEYVARLTSRELPTAYTISAFWGGQEGSLLLLAPRPTGYAAVAVRLGKKATRDVVAWTVPVLAGVALFFAWLLVFVASPSCSRPHPRRRRTEPQPPEPVHGRPPAAAVSRLRRAHGAVRVRDGCPPRGRTDERWIVATRRWTLVAWTALGIGQLLGAHWAYVEVGWGGYYAWDPVENAALMPWLVATAYLTA